jgi:hypothetical protein
LTDSIVAYNAGTNFNLTTIGKFYDTVFFSTAKMIELIPDNRGINILPNPGDEEIMFKCYFPAREIRILDAYGKVVFSSSTEQPFPHFKLTTSDFSNGIYYVQITGEDKIVMSKFIIQH